MARINPLALQVHHHLGLVTLQKQRILYCSLQAQTVAWKDEPSCQMVNERRAFMSDGEDKAQLSLHPGWNQNMKWGMHLNGTHCHPLAPDASGTI